MASESWPSVVNGPLTFCICSRKSYFSVIVSITYLLAFLKGKKFFFFSIKRIVFTKAACCDHNSVFVHSSKVTCLYISMGNCEWAVLWNCPNLPLARTGSSAAVSLLSLSLSFWRITPPSVDSQEGSLLGVQKPTSTGCSPGNKLWVWGGTTWNSFMPLKKL